MGARFHEEGGAARPLPFFVYWRTRQRQLFLFRARVLAWTAREARHGFAPPRRDALAGARVVGVKLARTDAARDGRTAALGRWVG